VLCLHLYVDSTQDHTKLLFYIIIIDTFQFSVDANDKYFDINLKCIEGELRKMANKLRWSVGNTEYDLFLSLSMCFEIYVNV